MGKDLNGKDLGRGFTQRADGMYLGRYTIKGVRIFAYSTKLSECKEKLSVKKNKLLADLTIGVDIQNKYRLTLDQWFNKWLKEYKNPYLKESIVADINEKYNLTFGSILGENKLMNILNIDIQIAVNSMCINGEPIPSIIEAYKILKECLEVAMNNNILTTNPAIGISLPLKNR